MSEVEKTVVKFSSYRKSEKETLQKLFYDVFTASEGESEGKLVSDLAVDLVNTVADQDIFGYVAKEKEKIIASIFFTRLSFDTPREAFILAPVAVDTSYQGRGIGQQLINYGIEELKEKKVELIFTYGDPDFYSKTGFHFITEEMVKAPFELTYPHGWQCQSLVSDEVVPIAEIPKCVEALNKQEYW